MQTDVNRADAAPAQQPSRQPGELDGISYFIEQMGLSGQTDGLPRIAGRIAGYFIIHGGPISFAQLAEELKVSRGSMRTLVLMLPRLTFNSLPNWPKS